jgi:hypothetical protein
MNKFNSKAAVAGALLLLAAAHAGATAKVSYLNPEKMTDVPKFGPERESMEYLLNEHIEQLSEKLPAGQVLKLEFLDIDLAGDVFPRVPVRDIRVRRGLGDWPRLHFRYSVEQDGQVIKQGERELMNRNYLQNYSGARDDSLGYEKQLLDEWFKKDGLAGR